MNGHDKLDASSHDGAAYDKVKSLATLIRTCRTRSEVHELLSLLPMMGDYVRLPNGDDVSLQSVRVLRAEAKSGAH